MRVYIVDPITLLIESAKAYLKAQEDYARLGPSRDRWRLINTSRASLERRIATAEAYMKLVEEKA